VLRESGKYLKDRGIGEPHLNAERLLCHVLGLRREELTLQCDRFVSPGHRSRIRTLLRRRASRHPLQYLTGDTEFYGLPVRVNRRVLIPRPETEVLVEKAVEEIHGLFATPVRILDIGTGSGNIAVALVKNVPESACTALDVDESILDVARGNALLNGVDDRIRMVRGNFLRDVFFKKICAPFDVVVSNPPYVTTEEYESLAPEIRDHEPRKALDAGPDGLVFFRRLAEILPVLLKRNGIALFETGETQAKDVGALFRKAGFEDIRVIQDYNHKDRVVLIRDLQGRNMK